MFRFEISEIFHRGAERLTAGLLIALIQDSQFLSKSAGDYPDVKYSLLVYPDPTSDKLRARHVEVAVKPVAKVIISWHRSPQENRPGGR